MANRGRTHSADKPAGGIKGDVPVAEGVGPRVMKGAGGAMPSDVEDSSARIDPRFEPHTKTELPRELDNAARAHEGTDHVHVSDPNQARSQPMAGGGIGGTDEGRERDVGDDVGSKDDYGLDERPSSATMKD